MEAIFENYEAFYNMVLSTTIMSNAPTPEFIADSTAIIEFIGKAYKLSDEFIEYANSLILDKLITLGLTVDQQAVYASRQYGETYTDEDVLFDIKGDVLTKIQSIAENANPEVNPNWFDYSHYKTYRASVRFAKINTTSASGNLIATRQAGILKILGIGCEKNVKEGIVRLTQCALWGDIPAMYLLAYAYDLDGNVEKARIMSELAEISNQYLKMGFTVLPKEVKDKYSEEAVSYYVYISTIKQDIVYAYDKKNIDFSFIEAVTSDELDYFDRMGFINNYERKDWKDVTNSAVKPLRKLGFN